MKILIVETTPIKNKTNVVVHLRNSILISEYLQQRGYDCRLVSEESDISDISEQFDFIIFVSATFYFKFQKFLELMKNQKDCKVGWISNEVDNFQNDFLKKWGTDFIIANYEEAGVKKAHSHTKYLLTNLNALQARLRNPITPKKHDMCYFGTHRKWRVGYFEKYLINDIILSTSSKNVRKFMLSGCDCFLTDPFSWEDGNETLNLFWATLGIEDTITHRVFNHLPNRWFESLFCNCAIFFDKTCQGSIDRDVFTIDKWFMVDSYDEMAGKVKELKSGKDIEEHFDVNTKIALIEKDKTLREVEQFLLNY